MDEEYGLLNPFHNLRWPDIAEIGFEEKAAGQRNDDNKPKRETERADALLIQVH